MKKDNSFPAPLSLGRIKIDELSGASFSFHFLNFLSPQQCRSSKQSAVPPPAHKGIDMRRKIKEINPRKDVNSTPKNFLQQNEEEMLICSAR